MKKVLFGIAFLGAMAFAGVTNADNYGIEKNYYGEVECPNGETMTVRGKCCEPGSMHYCSYVSCSNYTPISPTCPSVGN